MAKSDHKEELINKTNVLTGGYDKSKYLLFQLKESIRKANRIDIIVSFLMESGIKMILKDLEEALDKGSKIRILTGNYLGITQPSALYLIKEKLGNQVELRFFNESNRSFHPKSYIFHYDDYDEIYIGSSNLSKSALTSGIEWNYRFTSNDDFNSYQQFYEEFEDLFFHHSIVVDDKTLKAYSKTWRRPSVYKDIDRWKSELEVEDSEAIYEPRGAQIEALYALKNSRDEGADKGLVQAATGVGKTYLAAFDSREFNKILFVAHREEILKQAAESFKNVRKSNDYGFFDGNEKTNDKSVIFASVSTLGRSEYLNENYFSRDYFDYIVIDEFHHAVTNQYKRIVEYFKPKFMLGLTATPERMDGKNIYELCDYNVPYEISLKEAINKGMLVPFHYYGIYDETDYSTIKIIRGRYDDQELSDAYIRNNKRNELIYKYYKKYNSKRALGFCCSRRHAESMAKVFNAYGIPSAAVYSNADGEYSLDREQAIQRLKDGEIKVIFSVDMFNEGVDIPNVDMVMFLRPTESPIIFLQQLGRGLRKHEDKQYLNVLDFIGNYEKAGNVRYFLGDNTNLKIANTNRMYNMDYPEDCIIDFDMRLIDLFEKLDNKNLTLKERVNKEYYKVKQELGKVPTRVELFTYMNDDIYNLCMSNSKINPFNKYLNFLNRLHELNEEEKELYQSIGKEFVSLIETTSMQKVYKMPVLMALYNNGDIRMQVTDEELLTVWKTFFNKGLNWKDIEKNPTKYKKISDKSHMNNITKNPVHFLINSGKGLLIEKEGYAIAIREDLEPFITTSVCKQHIQDILEYRTLDYYRRRYKEN